jgi:predicted MFS family arabinose efflux permease
MGERPPFSRGQAWLALAAMLAIYFFSYIQRAAIPGTIFDDIQMDMGLSAATVAGLGSLFLGIYAGSQLFIGMAADRFGGRRTLLWGAILMVAGALWFPNSRSVFTLYTARVLTGLGSSFMFLSIVHEVELLFGSRRFPAVMGVVVFAGLAGGMTSTLPFSALATSQGWREALLEVGLLTALAVTGYWLVMRRLPPSDHVRVQLSYRPLRDVLFSMKNVPFMVGSMSNFSVFFVVQNVVGKKFLQDVAGLGVNRAATFVLVMAAAGACGAFLTGFWLRLSGQRRRPLLIAFGLMLLAGIALLCLTVEFQGPALCYLLAFMLMSFSMASSPIYSTVIKEINRPDCVAQSVAALNAVTYLGVSLMTALAGWILDRFESSSTLTLAGRLYPAAAYLTLFCVMGAISLFAIFCLCRVPETGPLIQAAAAGRPVPVGPQPEGDPI